MDDVIRKIEKRLNEPLPGLGSQLKMAPDRKIQTVPGSENFKESAVLILLHIYDDSTDFILIKRSEYDGPHSRQISFPGGKRSNKDASLLHTALRETEEEIGVNSKDIRILGKLTPLYIAVSKFMVYPYVGFMKKHTVFKPQAGEVEYIFSVSIQEILNSSLIKETTIYREKYCFKAPYFDLKNEIVWGATAMILSEFSDILKDSLNIT